MAYILKMQDVCKSYSKNLVLNGVNMNIEKGDVYGFVGENGSGKTTVIRLICGLIFANSGSFELFGAKNDSPEILNARKKVGAIVETPSIYKNFSAKDNLKLQCDLLGISYDSIEKVLSDVGLSALYTDKKKAGDFSLGMRGRLGIAMALLGNPEFLILDEPMNGLDPAGIVEIRELILRLNREKGITFLISSHILTELQMVATKYGIISKGKIIKEITAEELRHDCRPCVHIECKTPKALADLILPTLSQGDYAFSPWGLKIYGQIDLNATLQKIISAGIEITSVNTLDTNFEEYYLSIIGGGKNV